MESKFFNSLPANLGQKIDDGQAELRRRCDLLEIEVKKISDFHLTYSNQIASNTDRNFDKSYKDTLRRDRAVLFLAIVLSVVAGVVGVIW